MKIVVPSMGRASTITTPRIFGDCVVCVPEAEGDAYRAALVQFPGVSVVTHPDELLGIVRKRNWIIDNVTDDDAIVMIDDDLEAVVRVYHAAGEPEKMPASMAVDLVHATFCTAVNMGTVLFGWATSGAPMHFDALRPLRRVGFVLGGAFGLVNGHGLRFDERLQVHEDFDISALNAYRRRTCFKDARFYFHFRKTFGNAGGLSLHRHGTAEVDAVALLRRKYGEDIFPPKRKVNPWQADYAGGSKVCMRLPF